MAPQGNLCTLSCVNTRTEVYTSLPCWLSRVQPKPNGQVVMVRQDSKVTIEINLRGLPVPPGQQFTTWKGLVIPSTAGVKTDDYTGERDLLHVSVRVFGADTKAECDAVCKKCNKREGKKKGRPSLVDFHASSDVIRASEDGLVRVKFQFSCYPTHQHPNESAYLWVGSSTPVLILIDCRLEVALNPRGQTSHLAMCRLPWHFKVGRRQPADTARTAPAGGIVAPLNGVENPCEQQPVTGDTPARPAGPEAMRRVPTINVAIPVVQPPPLSSLPEGEPQVISHPQTETTCLRPSSNLVARPTVSNKRRWDAADLYDGDAPPTATGRQVRPRLDSMDGCEAGSQSNSAQPNPPPPCSTTASIGHEASLTPHRPNPTERSPARPTVHVPPTVPSRLSPSASAPSSESSVEPSDNHVSRSQQHISPDTREGDTTEAGAVGLTLQSTNPDTGPIAGGIPIWLSVLNLPTEFPLFARFGTNVTATVSPHEYSLSPILNLLVGDRKSQHIVLRTPFYDHSWSCACYTISLSFSQSTTVWSQHG